MSTLQCAKNALEWQRVPAVEAALDWAMTPRRASSPLDAALCGLAAGLAGTVALNASNLVEQWWTQRPNSEVPGRTLEHMLGLGKQSGTKRKATIHTFQWGTGAVMGAVRGLMSRAGMRGPYADLVHTAARVCMDQSLENATGDSAPPWTWPKDEQLLDLAHKAVYAVTCGLLVDRWVQSAKAVASNRQS